MDDLINELLDMDLVDENDRVMFTDKSKELIQIIAVQCRHTEMYKKATDKGVEYAKEMTAEELYIDMLVKIVNAQTNFHMLSVPRVLIPLLDDKLNGDFGR